MTDDASRYVLLYIVLKKKLRHAFYYVYHWFKLNKQAIRIILYILISMYNVI